MANVIVKETLHPDNDDNIDIYPKTSYDQIVNPPDLNRYQEKNTLEQDIESLGFEKVEANPILSASSSLDKIKIGNYIYYIQSGTYYLHEITLNFTGVNISVKFIGITNNMEMINDIDKFCINYKFLHFSYGNDGSKNVIASSCDISTQFIYMIGRDFSLSNASVVANKYPLNVMSYSDVVTEL